MKDKAIAKLIKREEERQKRDVPLIASENIVSKDVIEAQASVFINKYGEGKPGRRYYAGNKIVDDMERLAVKRALDLFVKPVVGANELENWHANVQPLSGSPANLAVYAALLKPGDTILAMDLASGGHLSHGHSVTYPGQIYNIVQYGVDKKTEQLDYKEIERLAKKHKPKLVIAGASAYPRTIDFERFAKIAHEVKSYLMADISHVAGLVVAGVHPSPIPFADVITTTTHKTLRGPRGAIIICKQELADAIDKGVFPGIQGGPHLNQIAAKAVCFYEAMQPEFVEYAKQVVANAQVLATELAAGGLRVVSGGTDNHLILVDVTSKGMTGKVVQEKLEQAGIITNANQIPFDTRSPFDPSGLRLGTAAITTLGYKEKETRALGKKIVSILK